MSARPAEAGLSPLDEVWARVRGNLTPGLPDHVVRRGASLPFAQASREIEAFRRVSVSLSTVRRYTLKGGAALEKRTEQEVERLEREAPAPPPGPQRLVVSVDGARVPLRQGEWAEVKTLAVGSVNGRQPDGGVRTDDWSYFSRLADAKTFERLALRETDRRGLTTAERGAAVTDEAEWIQGFIDPHPPDAVRIPDFPHAAQRVSDPFGDFGRGEGVGGGATDPAEGGGARAAFVREGSGV